MCRVFAVVFCQMGLFSARERLGEFFLAWRQQAITGTRAYTRAARATGVHCRHFNCFDQVRESLLLEVRLLRETLREAQGDIERCRYFSSEMSRREAEITQRADAKVD